VLLRAIAVAPTSSFRERSAASRLRSLRSPLRGLDLAYTLPNLSAIVGAPARLFLISCEKRRESCPESSHQPAAGRSGDVQFSTETPTGFAHP
jgi:hypothetical protein